MNRNKNKTALVTGGCGFIGSHLADRLIQDNYKVIIIDNLSTGALNNLNSSAIFYQGDVSDKSFVAKVFQQHEINIVFHQATTINTNALQENPLHDVDSSVNSTIILANLCLKHNIDKFIFASSVAVYGRSEKLPANEYSKIEPIYSYGISKHTAELYLKYFSNYYGLNYQILRYANVFGPRQPIFGEVGVIAIYTEKLIKEDELVIFGTGENQRDYIYVSDVVDFTVKSISFKNSETFNVGNGKPISVKDVFNVFSKFGIKQKTAVFRPERFGEIGNFYCDVSKAFSTGWTTNVSLEEGIEKTITYFKNK